jgi:glucoamylase
MIGAHLKTLIFCLVSAFLFCLNAYGEPLYASDDFEIQRLQSIDWIMSNLHAGPKPGIVLASTTKSEPNYFFHWVRDSAITVLELQSVKTQTADIQLKSELEKFFYNHTALNIKLQSLDHVQTGLGEPKFQADGTPDREAWGRPQNDGPALRAIGDMQLWETLATPPPFSLVQKDLDYVASHWREPGYDLWEESYGFHFFTLVAQRRALILGADFSRRHGHVESAQIYTANAAAITQVLPHFWNASRRRLVPTLFQVPGLGIVLPRDIMSFLSILKFTFAKGQGLDLAVFLAAIVDPTLPSVFQDELLQTALTFQKSFMHKYPVDSANWLAGRYPEDTYNGVSGNSQGNPWFIGNQTMAQFYYQTALDIIHEKKIAIRFGNQNFYKTVLGSSLPLAPQVIDANNEDYKRILKTLFAIGDRYLEVTLKYHGSDGSLAEEIDRNSGRQCGARNLTWSHVSYLSAVRVRSALIASSSILH